MENKDKIRTIIMLCLFGVLMSCQNEKTLVPVRLIAEWEPKKEIIVGFRTFDMGPEFEYATIRMIKALSQDEKVKVIVQDSSLLPEGEAFFAENNCDTSNIDILYDDPTYFWIRDPGPIFYKDSSGRTALADFRFGYYLNVSLDSIDSLDIPMEHYDSQFAKEHSIPAIESSLSIEGGGFETNGSGTVILVESVILNRNPDWTKNDIEAELRDKFGVQTIIWLPWGLAEDPYYMGHLYEDFFGFGTGGHSDEFVRFVNDSTIFLAWEFHDPHPDFPLREKNRERMAVNIEILESSKDWRGKNFTIEKVPIPEIFYKTDVIDPETSEYLQNEYPDLSFSTGDTIKTIACTSYLNFVIGNSTVLIPKYWHYSVPELQKEKDQQVYELFQKYFPERAVTQINPLVLNYAGGGMHCASLGIPVQE